MRVAIIFDMEGVAQLRDFAELCPIYEDYWRTGRQKLTSDVTAAALGLLDGGATEVAILNHHGAGEIEWPNLITDSLPSGVTKIDDWYTPELRDHADAVLQVGCHARGGSPSFASHTILPGLRLRLNGELFNESQWWALTGTVPVLGIVGSEALGAELGFLSDVPFLAVQSGVDRRTPRPMFATQDESAAAIRAFARAAVRDAGKRHGYSPHDLLLEASIQNSDDAAAPMGAAGWVRTSRTEFRIQATDWRADGEPMDTAIYAAIDAAWAPYSWSLEGLDPSSEASSRSFPRDAFTRTDKVFRSWAGDPMEQWITPQIAARWEGLETGQA
ncbi:MAG: M55 family metallopeptidase [Chloroflexi bacterium]|nr:M55 family metallopeptidase [Chloroflexota bacterium]